MWVKLGGARELRKLFVLVRLPSMHRVLAEWIDGAIIRLACRHTPECGRLNHNPLEAAKLLESEDFFCHQVSPPSNLLPPAGGPFRFASSVPGSCAESNTVYGTFYPCRGDWSSRPTAILLHGWNDEIGYRFRSPYVAKRLVRRDVNALCIELPFHLRRRPRRPEVPGDFISEDLWRTVEAARQSIGDTRSLVAWLKLHTRGPVAVWGISLGGWITGLVAAHDPALDVAVLMTPVVDMQRVVRELPFCEPLRRSLANAGLNIDVLNPAQYQPRLAPGRILLIEAIYDKFAPAETVEQLWSAWREPEIWRLRHGHISVLLSMPIMRRTVQWLAHKLHSATSGNASPTPLVWPEL